MKQLNLLGLSLLFAFVLTGQKLFAQDTDLTHLIVNNDFEYIAEGVPHTWTTWRPKDGASNQGHTGFYGWECDLSILGGVSQGINQDVENHNGTYGAWFASSTAFPDFWEFYQIIDGLEAGTYKVQCRLSGTKKPTSQRLFANQNVQYFLSEDQYEHNQTEGEIATFAGHSNPEADRTLSEMEVYTTIGEDESLKIGIQTGGKKGDGSTPGNENPAWGWFKVDYFRLTKIDNGTGLADNSMAKASCFVNNGNLTVVGADAYAVYHVNGTKVADVKDNNMNTAISLKQGVYVVKTSNTGVFKVAVK